MESPPISASPSEEVRSEVKPNVKSVPEVSPTFAQFDAPKKDDFFMYAEALYSLIDLGFDKDEAKLALKVYKGNINGAASILPFVTFKL